MADELDARLLLGLHLNYIACVGAPLRITRYRFCEAPSPYDLPDRADRIDDRSAGRIGHEPGERFETTSALRITREREDERLLRWQPGDRGLQNLNEALGE
jgi:hypothetical protein